MDTLWPSHSHFQLSELTRNRMLQVVGWEGGAGSGIQQWRVFIRVFTLMNLRDVYTHVFCVPLHPEEGGHDVKSWIDHVVYYHS